ncbi:hypothetical protein BC829DRAFT_176719 [Chytridium lagenaria]|nr:hypothetical protein BC829DRAFT_176719 [Chytridium lagenaria]
MLLKHNRTNSIPPNLIIHDNILSNSVNLTRGGVTEPYSALFNISCSSDVQFLSSLRPLSGWNPANIAIVSNGFCGSTCAETVRALRAHGNVRTFVYGGTSKAPFQPTSFEGGLVASFESAFESFDLLPQITPPSSPLPKSLRFPAVGQVLFWESYSRRGQEMPDEWTPQPADEYVDVRDPTEIVDVWESVAAKMPTEKYRLDETIMPKLVVATVTAFKVPPTEEPRKSEGTGNSRLLRTTVLIFGIMVGVVVV